VNVADYEDLAERVVAQAREALAKMTKAEAAKTEREFLRLLQIVNQRLNEHDKVTQRVSAVESRCTALERKVKA
jgi:hypothetical protein